MKFSGREHVPWTADRVKAWLEQAVDTLERLPDLEFRYLRNPLRSRFPEVIETAASAWAAAVAAYEANQGRPPETPDVKARPDSREIDRMEAALLGLPKPYLGISGDIPWLAYLSRRRRRLVWRRLTGAPWRNISALEHRSERTCQRWYREALEHIADELVTLEDG